MKVALVHDDLIQHGGAERVFEALINIFPKPDIYTSMATQHYLEKYKEYDLRTSFMQHLPFKKRLFRTYFPLYPLAFETFDFSQYDLVISSSSRFAHSIVTRPETTHVCYMHSPGRQFWEQDIYFQEYPRLGKVLTPLLSWFRCWDFSVAHRVDYFIANSKSTQDRIDKYYSRKSKIIHPFVDLDRFSLGWHGNKEIKEQWAQFCADKGIADCPPGFFLIVSRLAAWKRIDIAVKACNKLKQPLVIVGEGPDQKRLRKIAGPTVRVLGRLSDKDVLNCFQACKALIFPQREDFGITPLEAMACGKPVLAYKTGGALETILPGETGEFFYPQTVRALADAISHFDARRFRPQVCREQAAKFGRESFEDKFKDFIARIMSSGN